VTREPWTLADALELIRRLADNLRPTYCLGLTGTALLGCSPDKLELIVYPTSSARQDKAFADGALERTGIRLQYGRAVVTAKWRRNGSADMKHVEVWEYGGKNVDIFFLS